MDEIETSSGLIRKKDLPFRDDLISLHAVFDQYPTSACRLSPQLLYHFTDFPTTIFHPNMHLHPNIQGLVTRFFTQLASSIFALDSSLLSYNPMRQVFLMEFIMTDPAVFHALLYSGAVCAAVTNGLRESRDITVTMNRTIVLVNKRLGIGHGTEDTVIGAVSCLAMGEVGK